MSRIVSITRAAAALVFVMFQVLTPLAAQDWPQWRGPNRDGKIAPFTEPKSWPDQLKQKWQVQVGIGYSSPVLVGQRIYSFTRQAEEEVAACFDLETGKQVWRSSYPAPYTMNPAARGHGKGPKATPAFHEGKLYTFGISGILSCYDAENGRLRWRREFGAQHSSTAPSFGTAASPLVDRNLVITHVGGRDSGALTAMDAVTGKTAWSWNGDGPGYASPVVADLGGIRQVVTQSQKNLVGVSLAEGKLLWSLPFTTDYEQNVITPIILGQTLIYSGLEKGIMAVRPVQKSGGWSVEKVWENPEVPFYMSTPVSSGTLLFGMSHRNKGCFVALDARDGKMLWTTKGREGDNAAVLIGGDKLFFLTSDAEFIVARAGAGGFEVLRRYTVAKSPTWAHPVLAGKRLLVKDAESLILWGLD